MTLRLCSNARHHSSSDLSFIVPVPQKYLEIFADIYINLDEFEYIGNRKNPSKGNIIMG